MGALYGHEVVSELPLERLREGAGPRGTLTVRRAGEQADPGGEAVVRIDDEFAVHRTPGGLTMWCGATGTYVLDPAERAITAAPKGEPSDWWEHRLACVAVPLLLAEAGDLVLHASAVEAAGTAVAFVGESGRGKSTTAWALGERGCNVLAEDGAVITPAPEPVLWPGLHGVRLRDPRGGKRPIVSGAGGTADPLPLRAVVLLQPRGGDAPALERLAPVDALLATMPNTVHAQGPSLEAAFRGTAEIVRSVPLFSGRLPDDLAGAPAHAEGLLRLVLDAARSHDA